MTYKGDGTMNNVVVFCVTGNHFQLTTTAIISILENYHNLESLKIIIILENVQQADINYVRRLPKIYEKERVSIDCWAPPAIVKRFSKDFTIGVGVPVPPMAAWRLFVPSYFPMYDKILYLDNDIIVNGDISTLFSLLPNDKILAAVPDFLFAASNRYGSKYKSEQHYHVRNMRHYVNNGVMIIQTKLYNEAASPEKLLWMINKGNYHLADQTIVNVIAEDMIELLPWKYNFQHDLKWLEEIDDLNSNVVGEMRREYSDLFIRHFAGTGRLTCPYQHVRCTDYWEMEFWRLFFLSKQLSVDLEFD